MVWYQRLTIPELNYTDDTDVPTCPARRCALPRPNHQSYTSKTMLDSHLGASAITGFWQVRKGDPVPEVQWVRQFRPAQAVRNGIQPSPTSPNPLHPPQHLGFPLGEFLESGMLRLAPLGAGFAAGSLHGRGMPVVVLGSIGDQGLDQQLH